MLRFNIFTKAIWEKLPETKSENRENLNGDLPHVAHKDDTHFLNSVGYKICRYLKIISYST